MDARRWQSHPALEGSQDDNSASQSLDRALDPPNLGGPAAPLAADLAAERLASAPDTLTRRLFLEILRELGSASHLPALRAYAENPMVAEDLRKQAATVAEAIERRG